MRPAAARRRRQALREVLSRTIKIALDERVDAVLVGGDLYEQDRVVPDTAKFIRGRFEQLHPTRVYVAPGNHDWLGPSCVYRQVAWSPNVHVFQEARLAPVDLAEGLTLWGAAHCAPANTPGFLERFGVDCAGVNLALFHGPEQRLLAFQPEGKVPHAPFRAEQIAGAGLAHAFLGHYHRPQHTDLLTYPGNPDPLSFGEDGERGVVLATVGADGSITRERRSVADTKFHDPTVDLTGCASRQEALDRVTATLDGLEGFARVTITGEVAPEMDLRIEDLVRADERLEVTVHAAELRVSYDLETIAAEPTVRAEFVREVRSAGLPAEELRRVIVTGLRALDGRDDLEVL